MCSLADEKEPEIHLFHRKRHKGHSELPKSRRPVASYAESQEPRSDNSSPPPTKQDGGRGTVTPHSCSSHMHLG